MRFLLTTECSDLPLTLQGGLLTPIRCVADAGKIGAMGATIEDVVRFHSVANHLAAAMITLGRQQMNRAFKTIEHMGFAR
jgi:hypothetical protein